ncbi:P63C domain-containing protein [Nitrosomonas oligotropha]|uniref:P63C domain-containing protein n=1 Tax=Nitrosomonas oligotropha TaxID=42354 RepID=UPI00136B5CB1|nr:P63C domain-containing protein [Nitrosomonas oligotropha]MXS84175.1 hypothetical protein [Nitrosomonas oligotropha]
MSILNNGKKAGGLARAKKLSSEERKRIAEKAAKTRWQNESLPIAQYAGELKFGDLIFPCAVLSDDTRVLTETDFMAGLGMYRSGALSVRREIDAESGAQIPLYLAFKNLLPYVVKYLGDVHIKPLKYKTLSGSTAHGIPASIIPKICSVWLDARKDGILGKRQDQIADRAEMLLRGLAEVGIIALVDEATGYQNDRAKDALAKILEAFVAKELQPWVHTFPSEYYENLFRLRGLSFPRDSVKKPMYFGHLTNNIIYSRLAPKVLEQLKKDTPRDDKGRHKEHLHRRLTTDVGHPKLREHLASVITLMKISNRYGEFEGLLDRVHPKYNETMPLPFDYPESENGI